MRIIRLYRAARGARAASLWDLQLSSPISNDVGVSRKTQRWRVTGNFVGRIGAGLENASRCYAVALNSQLRGLLRGEDHPTGLLHVLRCEIADLRAKSKDIQLGSPPKPWKLVKDKPGELELTVERKFGLEDIVVSCIFQLVPKDYQRSPLQGEDPEMRTKVMQLTISITKGAEYPALKLLCECYRDGFAVHQVDMKSDSPDETAYRPYFSESKAGLVDEVQIFLYERGLNDTLATYLHKSLEYKRLLKSAEMLEKIESFFK